MPIHSSCQLAYLRPTNGGMTKAMRVAIEASDCRFFRSDGLQNPLHISYSLQFSLFHGKTSTQGSRRINIVNSVTRLILYAETNKRNAAALEGVLKAQAEHRSGREWGKEIEVKCDDIRKLNSLNDLKLEFVYYNSPLHIEILNQQ
ncbi:hypothetical protein Agabi119p4_7821 [Agaricus bisporus var. burnettii]|uniref:Uncharacterized protein n=1 Tax=Agaricus bisporus var. burnettii TaxID=192524 RepID=A0A8H7C8H0_AGABI|nr:hypothetical protein Agabi119p4_7821 [Agaricus bisporus var. burnettii]